MNRMKPSFIQKVFVAVVLLFFVVPIATAFCCCKSEDHHQEESSPHEHGEHHHQESPQHNQHDDHGENGCECGFDNIASDATIPTIHFFQVNNSVVQWLNKSSASNQAFSKHQIKLTSSYLEGESPPGARFFSTPLFLQLQTLRI